jgi:hypothetical protein
MTPIPINEQNPRSGRIAWWIENTLVRWVKRVINDTSNNIRQLFSFSLTDFIESMEQDLISIIRPFVNQILAMDGLPSYIRQPISEAMTGEKQAGIIILAILVPVLAAGLNAGLGGPLGRILEGGFDQLLRSRLVDPGTLIAMRQRNIIDEGFFRQLMAKNGLNETAINSLIQLSRPLYDDTTLANAYWRDTMSGGDVRRELKSRGMSDEQIGVWFSNLERIPSINDLISMSVREGFNDSVASRFGYDENFPSDVVEWAEKQGLSREWVVRYWRAHWNLPGLVQVREMFHRGIINETDIDLYLRAADYPAFWRDKITKWTYAEITRVDVRRIYDLGLIDENEVYKRYLALGYKPEDARLMTVWTAAEYREETRELTKTDILTMYRDGLLNHTEAVASLSGLGYRSGDIELLLAHQDVKRQAEYEQQIISNVKAMYIAGTIDKNRVIHELGVLDTPASFVEQSIRVWDIEKEKKIIRPTPTQLRDMVMDGVISMEQFKNEMSNRGYNDEYIEWYKSLWFRGDN